MRSSHKVLLLLILFIFVSFRANAIIPCPYARVSQFRNFEDLRTNARWIKDHEPHTDLSEKINGVIAKKFLAATGALVCDGKPIGSANLVCGGRVLVLAGHLFHKPTNSCNFTVPPDSCSFRTSSSNETIEVPIEKLNKMGTTCSDGSRFDPDHDWAVVTLKDAISNTPPNAGASVKPYTLGNPDDVSIGQPLIGACAKSVDVIVRDKVSGKLGQPRVWSFGSKEEEITDGFSKGLWSASISGSFGCSGGGLINKNHELMAIMIHSKESLADVNNLMRRPDLNYHEMPCEYTPGGDCKTFWLPIKGEFATAVKDACTDQAN